MRKIYLMKKFIYSEPMSRGTINLLIVWIISKRVFNYTEENYLSVMQSLLLVNKFEFKKDEF